MSTKRYHIWTVGCQMNVADSDKLAAGLQRLGLEPVDSPEEADLVVLNTCSVRQHAEERAISKLGVLKKLKSRRQFTIAVMGLTISDAPCSSVTDLSKVMQHEISGKSKDISTSMQI